MLVRRQDYDIAIDLLGGLESHNYPIELIEFEMNDLWMRDTGPAFVIMDILTFMHASQNPES